MRIDGTSFGSITVDGKTYHHDIWVFADGGLRRRDRNHEFTLDEFYELLRGEPEVLVVGTGQAGCVGIEKAVIREAERRGIELISTETPRAISLFNETVKSGRRVAAAFHTTC